MPNITNPGYNLLSVAYPRGGRGCRPFWWPNGHKFSRVEWIMLIITELSIVKKLIHLCFFIPPRQNWLAAKRGTFSNICNSGIPNEMNIFIGHAKHNCSTFFYFAICGNKNSAKLGNNGKSAVLTRDPPHPLKYFLKMWKADEATRLSKNNIQWSLPLHGHNKLKLLKRREIHKTNL